MGKSATGRRSQELSGMTAPYFRHIAGMAGSGMVSRQQLKLSGVADAWKWEFWEWECREVSEAPSSCTRLRKGEQVRAQFGPGNASNALDFKHSLGRDFGFFPAKDGAFVYAQHLAQLLKRERRIGSHPIRL
jgi:hypothetical protein